MYRKLSTLLAFFLFSFWFTGLVAASPPDASVLVAAETIKAENLKSALYFLASDEMQGREVNTLSNKITSSYLAHRFELMGLEPVFDDSYYQYFYLVQGKISQDNHLEIRRSNSTLSTVAILNENYFPSTLSANGRVTAPLVFAGYGITASEYEYDDYQGLEVAGKIAVVLEGEPNARDPESRFEGLLDTQYSQELNKILNAQAQGAVGLIIAHSSLHRPGNRRFSRRARSVWTENPKRARYNLEVWTEMVKIPVVHASEGFARILLRDASLQLNDIQKKIDQEYRSHGLALLDSEATMETAVVRNRTRIRNVLAYLPGSDPDLKDEWVVLSAHFDHVGSHDGEIFNGADDDASGTVALLEMAEAFAVADEKPRRSILFAGWNAEERGLLGSWYYTVKPPHPLGKTVALFQMDMIGRNEEVPDPGSPRFRGLEKQTAAENTNTLHLLGYSRSPELRSLVTRQNQLIGLDLKLQYDHNPSNLLRRSDHWPFLVSNVPALFFHTGLHPDYHRPTDTANKINYAKLEKIARLIFLCTWEAADRLTPDP